MTLEIGARGEEVKRLQSILKREGFFEGAIGGNFLKLTKAAVVAFQQSHINQGGQPLRVDGVVDDDTWWALQNLGKSAAGEPTLKYGAKGHWVRVIQQILKDQGFFRGAVRGNFSKLTNEAVVYFQQTHVGPDGEFLDSDGVVGKNTWWALRNPVGIPQQSNLAGEIPDGLTPMRQKALSLALAEHAAGVREVPDGTNTGDGVAKYLPGGRGAAWCCYFWSWIDRKAFGRQSLGAKYGRVSSAFAKARKLGMAREKEGYVPIPGDAFIMATSEDEEGKFKFTGTGHIGYVLRVAVSGGRAVAINTVEGNSSNRVKIGKRNLSDASIVGFINNYGPSEQPTDWTVGLVGAADAGGTDTR